MRLSARISKIEKAAQIQSTPSLAAPIKAVPRLVVGFSEPKINARLFERTTTPLTGSPSLFVSPHYYLTEQFKLYDSLGVLHLLDAVPNPLGHNGLGFPYPAIPLIPYGSLDATVAPSEPGMWRLPGIALPAPTVVIPSFRIPSHLGPISGLPYSLYLAGYIVVFQLYESITVPVHADIDATRIALYGFEYGATVAYEALDANPTFKGAVLHQGNYYWPALIGSLTYTPLNTLISATDPALLESSSPIHLANGTQLLYLSGEGAQGSQDFTGPPWITDTLTKQYDSWHTGALIFRLLNLGNTSVTWENAFDEQKMYNWIIANV